MKLRYKLFYMLICNLLFIQATVAQQGSLLFTSYIPSFNSGSISAFLDDIQQKTKVLISFSDATVDPAAQVSVTGNERNIDDALKAILSHQKVSVIERKDKILIVSRSAKKKFLRQAQRSLDGYIKEKGSNEVLIGSILYIPELQVGTVSNNYGFYSLTLPEGDYTAVCSYTGYKPDTFQLHLQQDTRKDIFLSSGNVLTEVKVTTKSDPTPDHTQLSLKDINNKPALLGENDVMRALQNIAGVQSAADGFSTVLVRGGDPGQNLNLLDGVPVYYVDHFFGLTSVFNAEAVKNVNFYKGAFPSRFGGRVSSVIDVNTKDGDMEKYGGQFTIGLVKSSLNLEGPIVKDKASVMFSARRTWIDGLWRPFTNELGLDFYDINSKVNYILNKNNRLYLSFYNGRDQIKANLQSPNIRVRWGNTIGAAKWNTIINPRLFVNTILTYSFFKYELKDKSDVFGIDSGNKKNGYTGKSLINDASLKMQAHWYPAANHKVETGIQYSYAKFTPVSVTPDDPVKALATANPGINTFFSNEVTMYLEDEITVGKKWSLRPGLHWANWFSTDYSYSNLQPRMFASYKLAPRHLLFASFTQMAQFLHLITNNTYGMPADFWLPSTSRLQPEEAMMGTLGYTGDFSKNKFTYTIEGYYKHIDNVTMFNVGKDLFDNNSHWENKMMQGKGWSYGTEISINKQWNKVTTSLAYTLSSTWRQFAALNEGKAFPYRYDRRHNLKAALIYEPNKKFAATANWTFMSGEAITIPDQIYGDLDNNLLINANTPLSSTMYTYSYSQWNNYRLPAIHRLDVSFDFHKQKRRSERTWSLGMFNVYGRRNVLFVTVDPASNPGEFRLKGTSVLQYIPYVSYKLKFW